MSGVITFFPVSTIGNMTTVQQELFETADSRQYLGCPIRFIEPLYVVEMCFPYRLLFALVGSHHGRHYRASTVATTGNSPSII